MMILFLLTFLSNAPVVTAVRDLTNPGSVNANVAVSLIGAAVIVLILAPLTVRAYMRKA